MLYSYQSQNTDSASDEILSQNDFCGDTYGFTLSFFNTFEYFCG